MDTKASYFMNHTVIMNAAEIIQMWLDMLNLHIK